MTSGLDSLDQVLRGEQMVSALAERRLAQVRVCDPYGDDLGELLADWCAALDAGHPATDPQAVSQIAESAARRSRRFLRGPVGRSILAAGAVAAICVGGLAVSRMSPHLGADEPNAGPSIRSDLQTSARPFQESQQARLLIWQELQAARTALSQRRWAVARALLDTARSQLHLVSPLDGRSMLADWMDELTRALHRHRAVTPAPTTDPFGPTGYGPSSTASGVDPTTWPGGPPASTGPTTGPTGAPGPTTGPTGPTPPPSRQPAPTPTTAPPTTAPTNPPTTAPPTNPPTTEPPSTTPSRPSRKPTRHPPPGPTQAVSAGP